VRYADGKVSVVVNSLM